MRRLLISLTLALTLALTMVGSALGHVHGLTPLRCVGVADDGANQVDNTPASADQWRTDLRPDPARRWQRPAHRWRRWLRHAGLSRLSRN